VGGVFGTSVINASLAVLVHRSAYCSHDWIGRVLSWKLIAFVGVLSHSLYLWQELFLTRNSPLGSTHSRRTWFMQSRLGSHSLLEKPLLKLLRRLRAERGPQ
jgi:peptidoglycan/LPS O-acetylase OafA/YrhL